MTPAGVADRRQKRSAVRVILCVAVVLIAGCVRPSVPLTPAYRQPWVEFFVAHTPGDDLAMEEAIADALRHRGFTADSGAFEAMAPEADVLVIYELRWWQNILVRAEVLHLELRDTRTGATIAAGSGRALSLIGQRATELAGDAVGELLDSSL